MSYLETYARAANATMMQRFPKTRSGKILRGMIRNIANNEEWTIPATIDDPQILADVAVALGNLEYPTEKT